MNPEPSIPELEGVSRRRIAFIIAMLLLFTILVIGAYLISQQGAPPSEPLPPMPEPHMHP